VNDAQLLENAVVNQLANYGDLSFYNKRNTAEIDVIYNKKIAIEIKASGSESDRRKLTELSGSLGIKQNYIISKNFVEKDGFVSPAQL